MGDLVVALSDDGDVEFAAGGLELALRAVDQGRGGEDAAAEGFLERVGAGRCEAVAGPPVRRSWKRARSRLKPTVSAFAMLFAMTSCR